MSSPGSSAPGCLRLILQYCGPALEAATGNPPDVRCRAVNGLAHDVSAAVLVPKDCAPEGMAAILRAMSVAQKQAKIRGWNLTVGLVAENTDLACIMMSERMMGL